jgi:tetratricopeptide (TPR) repeat protein
MYFASYGTAKMSRMSRRVKTIEPAPIIAILVAMMIPAGILVGGPPVSELPAFDKLWNYNDPAATEAKFRELLPAAEQSVDRSYHAQLLTQIARTQGLQGHFDDAHSTLDSVEKVLTDELKLARVRYLLERGRVFNSAGQPANAMPLFEQSWKLAEQEKFPRYAVDAVHMLAIAAPTPKEQIEWNLRGLKMVEADPSQKGWLNALYNNLGESYAKAGEYEKALDAFEKLAAINGNNMYTMKDQARMLRLLGRVDRATEIIRPIHELLVKEGKRDGWISEEYAECLLAAGRADDATPHFRGAYEMLKDDRWLNKNEPAKLERLRRLGGER